MRAHISGFPEFFPGEQIAFNQTLEKIKNIFETFGFIPLETAAVEKTTTLLSKGNDHEIYGIYRLGEDLKSSGLALRFDLTVPLARFVGQYHAELAFPYKRYQIAPVWRGERAQSGRYRQFYQCDVDIIGDQTLNKHYDAELLKIAYQVLSGLGICNFQIQLNHRSILMGLLESCGVLGSSYHQVLRWIDKAAKISKESLLEGLYEEGLSKETIEKVYFMLFETPLKLEALCTHSLYQEGLSELKAIIEDAVLFGVPRECLKINLSLARGLSYYTGMVCETLWMDHIEMGSISAGGRYGQLCDNFSKKSLPGVGLSIGISRLFPKLIEEKLVSISKESTADVLVTVQKQSLCRQYISIVNQLRSQGIKTDFYLEDKPLSTQLKYAAKKSIPFVVIADENELFENQIILRDMEKQSQEKVALSGLVQQIKAYLSKESF